MHSQEKTSLKKLIASRSSIGTRLTLSIGLIISITVFVLFYSIYRNEERQHEEQIHAQAEALLSEMTLTREWIASYNGVWTTTPGDYFLNNEDGYYQKSPAMVTKELSDLSNDKRDYSFHITSLMLTNPENAPDSFEHDSLVQFEVEPEPITSIDRNGDEPVYRLMVPLKIQESCLECHTDQGYQVGDIRGGLSVIVPVSEMDASLANSRRMLTFSAIGIVGIVMIVLYMMVHRTIISPVGKLKEVAIAVSDGDYDTRSTLKTGDELEVFGKTLNQMVANLRKSQHSLQEGIKQRTQELETISEIAFIISKAGALDDVLAEALSKVLSISNATGGIVHLFEENNTRIVANQGLSPNITSCFKEIYRVAEVPPEKSILVRDIEKGVCKTIFPDQECKYEEGCQALAAGYTRLASILLKSRSRLLGTMILFSKEKESFSPESMQLFKSIGNQLGVAIENANYHQHIEEIAVLEERARISRELHDSLAQTLGWLSIKTEMLEEDLQLGKIEESKTEMKTIRRVTRDACYDVRESIDGLRTRPTGDLALTAAAWIAEFRQRSGLRTNFHTNEEKILLSPRVETELLRILQEALTNVRKHAKAKTVQINLNKEGNFIKLRVKDDGQGFDYKLEQSKKHFGLRIMRERAEKLGGSLHVKSEIEQGTRITAILPLYPTTSN
jgi:two-component system, NarL family, nitrate/nitrite sensor histidine kinase NarX